MEEKKRSHNREEYIENIEPGLLLAFVDGDGKMMSGKVMEKTGDIVKVTTLNGSVYYVPTSNIRWVKTGAYWPLGIYNALKESSKAAQPKAVEYGED